MLNTRLKPRRVRTPRQECTPFGPPEKYSTDRSRCGATWTRLEEAGPYSNDEAMELLLGQVPKNSTKTGESTKLGLETF